MKKALFLILVGYAAVWVFAFGLSKLAPPPSDRYCRIPGQETWCDRGQS